MSHSENRLKAAGRERMSAAPVKVGGRILTWTNLRTVVL